MDFVVETIDCSDNSAAGVKIDGEDGEEDADEVDAVLVVTAPEAVGGVGVRVLIPDVSDAGETTRRDLRLPFCWFTEFELKDGNDCVVEIGLIEATRKNKLNYKSRGSQGLKK